MNFTNRKFIIIFIVIVCFSVPILFALYESKQQSMRAMEHELLDYAYDVLVRSDETGDQIDSGVNRLKSVPKGSYCSEERINIMRKIDVGSSYIQAIGYVLNNTLQCSSLGASGFHWNLGPADLYVPKTKTKVRFNVRFPGSEQSFVVIEREHFAAVIHKNLPIDTALSSKEVSLALFTALPGHAIYTSRGYINPDWLNELGEAKESVFVQDAYIVALVKSKKYKIAALAAMPLAFMHHNTLTFALFLLPLALITSLVITYLIFYWSRLQMSGSSALRAALKREEFYLLYQPVYDLNTKKCVGAEALLRWKRMSGEQISPDVFIPLAEETDLINQLTKRAIDIVAREAALLFKKYPDFHIALNVSESDLHSDQIVRLVLALTEKTRSGPGNFIIEATERKMMMVDVVNPTLKHLRSKGIKIAIDDFGTGYSSLSYLEELKVDFLKIDKSFVDAMGTDASTSHVIFHIIEMAKALNLKIIAEGIENKMQEDLIKGLGVHFGQGFLYGTPMTLEALLLMLKRNATKNGL